MNPLIEVEKLGQSIWYDNIRRALIDSGDLAQKIGGLPTGVTSTLGQKVEGDDLRGVTSNPTIFEKAITGSTDYDEAMRRLVADGKSVDEIYEALVIEDIRRAADLFKPVYARTNKLDGYVSLEVSPLLARDTEGTIAEAERLWATLDRPNVMIKIPATPEGIPAIRECIAAGININVTMIFAIENYEEVAAAYISGLEQRAAAGRPIDHVASVASVFVSRIDTAVDGQLESRVRESEDESEKARLSDLLGRAAIANAKMQYKRFKEIFSSERFAKLKAQGARVQRPLWASTGTKNPNYSDVLYVESLIGPDTVNTLPPATFTAFRDHGKVRPTLEENLDEAKKTLADLAEAGIDLKRVCKKLQDDGVKAFADSFESLTQSITSKRAALTSGLLDRMEANLGKYESDVQAVIKRAESGQWTRKIWRKDASLWKQEECHQVVIKNSLGWVTVPDQLVEAADELPAFSGRVREDFKDVVLLGMGGSSLCPEVFRRTFGRIPGYPELHVLDSTDPATILAFESKVDLPKTIFVVASKSGTTIEPLMFYKYFLHEMRKVKGDRAGENFVAITDPSTLMEAMATGDKFRRIFLNPSDIGGRYSALSYFGMVPAALQGIDFKTTLDRAECAMHACAPAVPAADNPAVRLGAIIGALAGAGRNKLTLSTDPEISSLGLWIEQLVAESTGKEGKGILPVANEELGAPDAYGDDRLFIHIAVGMIDPEAENRLRAIEAAGHPVVRRVMNDTLDLGEEFYVWEMATAVAGAVLGINPFDQPNVQESKDNTKLLLEDFKRDGGLPEQTLAVEGRGLKVYCDDETVQALGKNLRVDAFITAHLKRVKPGDYVAMLDYIQETDENEALIQATRKHLRDALRVATTTGYGPRFLHSTGQLHKGGDSSGVFIQITADDSKDVSIVGEPFTFGVLKQAQALGDFQSLASRDRRAIRIHLGNDVPGGLRTLLEIVRKSFPVSKA
ncbi:MAG TPA: bifunctional transaldolase/phosoglucose isomerase [Blastocatellia bacterium]|jgi:transaldolase/glucose-6-phosphate isomerase|nr:bifunctional transaldolase/phosoglucose isomerase [Blastocatellia bacterium]